MAIGTSNGQVFENELDLTLARAAGQDHIKYYTEKYGTQGQEQDMKKAEEISTKVPRREEPVTPIDATMPLGASAEPAGALKGSAPILPTGRFDKRTDSGEYQVSDISRITPHANDNRNLQIQDPAMDAAIDQSWRELVKKNNRPVLKILPGGKQSMNDADERPIAGQQYAQAGDTKGWQGTYKREARDPEEGWLPDIEYAHPLDLMKVPHDWQEIRRSQDGKWLGLKLRPPNKDLISMTDETSDEIKAGAKYAMEARKEVIPIGPKGNEAGGGPAGPASNAIHIDKLPITKGPEKVTAAALRDGKDVYTGTSHLDVMLKNRNVDLNRVEDGFVTSHGRFVSRQQAMEVVKKSEQALTSRGRSGVMGKRKELMHFDIFPDIVQ